MIDTLEVLHLRLQLLAEKLKHRRPAREIKIREHITPYTDNQYTVIVHSTWYDGPTCVRF